MGNNNGKIWKTILAIGIASVLSFLVYIAIK